MRVYLLQETLTADLNAARLERAGLEYVAPLNELVAELATRAMTAQASVVPTDPSATESAARTRIDALATQISSVDARLGGELHVSSDWAKLASELAPLRRADAGGEANGAPRAVTALASALTLRQKLADESGLVLDPQMATYYLMDVGVIRLPDLMGQVSDLQASVQTLRSDAQASEQARNDYAVRRAAVLAGAVSIARELDVAAQNDATLKGRFANELAQLQKFVATLVSDSDAATAASSGAQNNSRWLEPFLAAPKSTHQLAKSVTEALDQRLEERVDHASAQRLGILLAMLGACALAWLLALALARNLTRRVTQVAQVFGAISRGNLDSPLEADGSDEIADVQRRTDSDTAQAEAAAHRGARTVQ